MQTTFSRRVGLQLLALVFAFAFASCAAAGGGGGSSETNRWNEQIVYTRVGMRVEPARRGGGWHMYSTNHIGLQKHVPAGSKFTARNIGRSRIDLVAEDGSVLQLEFVARHHSDLNFDSWLDRQLSMTAVELPGDLSPTERAAIQEGRYEVGMSRAALFLSIGHPPTVLSPSLEDSMLTYEVKRFNRIVFNFDEQGRISSIKN